MAVYLGDYALKKARPVSDKVPDRPAEKPSRKEGDSIITPEMVEAGLKVLHESGFLDYTSPSDAPLVREIYTAMIRCRASAGGRE